jgi:hypothetical protein
MRESLRLGDPPIEIELRRHNGARRMILRIGRAGRGPVLTAPRSASLAQARRFAIEQEDWLRRQLAAQPAAVTPAPGARIPFRGATLVVTPREAGPTEARDGRLFVSGPEAQTARRASAFLREAAREACLAAAERHCVSLGRRFGRLTIRDTRGRWGSCSAAGDLMFSWRLILAPEAVLDYVAAHEVAHLVEMNHSPRFWAVVRRLSPAHDAPRDWLRRNGPDLLAFRLA